jgi:hypothetical protein
VAKCNKELISCCFCSQDYALSERRQKRIRHSVCVQALGEKIGGSSGNNERPFFSTSNLCKKLIPCCFSQYYALSERRQKGIKEFYSSAGAC